MHVSTFTAINSITGAYVRELKKLREALLNQIAQVNAQIAVCEDFADDTVTMPLPAIDPEPQKAAEEEYRDPLLIQNMKAEAAEAAAKAASDEAAKPDGVINVNHEGRPILTPADLKRLDEAVNGS